MKELSASLDSCIQILTVPLEAEKSVNIVNLLRRREEGAINNVNTFEQFLDATDKVSGSKTYDDTTVHVLIEFVKSIDKKIRPYISLRAAYFDWCHILQFVPELIEYQVLRSIFLSRDTYIRNNNQWPQHMLEYPPETDD